MPKTDDYLVEVENLKKYFPVKTGLMKTSPLKAVDGISFKIPRGKTLGMVGESGCGKTTVGRVMLHLYPPTDGHIYYEGEEVTAANIDQYRQKMQMVFQDPYSSLNPRMTVADIIGEGLDVFRLYSSKEEREDKIQKLLSLVGLNSEHSSRYAHEFSGGQRQRIGIARALAVDPELIVCDEAVSALDVSIQAQILNTFQKLQAELGLTYLFIAHDILVVKHISQAIVVMYLGKIVESAETEELAANPLHPYTQSLFSAVPIPDPIQARKKERIILEGDVPSPLHVPAGCPFRPRCRYATDQCKAECPHLQDVGSGHQVACWNYEKAEGFSLI